MLKAKLGFYVFFSLLASVACSERLKEQSSQAKISDVSQRPNVFEDLTFGPEFEFDIPAERVEQRAEVAADRILAAYHMVRSSAKKFSDEITLLENGFVFDMARYSGFKEHFSKVTFTKETAQVSKFSTEYFRLSLVPKEGDPLFSDPVLIKYTKDDVLFEVHLSPLKLKQLKAVEPLVDLFVFESLTRSGLVIPKSGGGHIHIGVKGLVDSLSGDLTLTNKALYNFVTSLYTSDDFVKTFMRPHEVYAVMPSMVSPYGRQLVDQSLQAWFKEFSPLAIDDYTAYRMWLDDVFQDVTLVNYLHDVTADRAQGAFHNFNKFDDIIADRKAWNATPKTFLLMYSALRYRYHHDTLEIRALASQRKMSDFIFAARFFGGLLTGSSYMEPQLVATSLSKGEIYSHVLPNSVSEKAQTQAYKLLDIAGITDKEERIRTLLSIQPRLGICQDN
jgi:hypothetical protein